MCHTSRAPPLVLTAVVSGSERSACNHGDGVTGQLLKGNDNRDMSSLGSDRHRVPWLGVLARPSSWKRTESPKPGNRCGVCTRCFPLERAFSRRRVNACQQGSVSCQCKTTWTVNIPSIFQHGPDVVILKNVVGGAKSGRHPGNWPRVCAV